MTKNKHKFRSNSSQFRSKSGPIHTSTVQVPRAEGRLCQQVVTRRDLKEVGGHFQISKSLERQADCQQMKAVCVAKNQGLGAMIGAVAVQLGGSLPNGNDM